MSPSNSTGTEVNYHNEAKGTNYTLAQFDALFPSFMRDDSTTILNVGWTSENSMRFNQILEQYNQLIKDGGYKGVNLLEENQLKINFNETRSSKLAILGIEANYAKLGLQKASAQQAVSDTLSEISNAINSIRNYNRQFGNYYNIVSERESFTQNMINVLNEGSDKLTLADMNEESANMLALKTRQMLAVNALSLASQSSRSILGLF